MSDLISPYSLHPLMMEDVLQEEHSTLFDLYHQTMYFEFPVFNEGETRTTAAHLSVLLIPHRMITIQLFLPDGLVRLIRPGTNPD